MISRRASNCSLWRKKIGFADGQLSHQGIHFLAVALQPLQIGGAVVDDAMIHAIGDDQGQIGILVGIKRHAGDIDHQRLQTGEIRIGQQVGDGGHDGVSSHRARR